MKFQSTQYGHGLKIAINYIDFTRYLSHYVRLDSLQMENNTTLKVQILTHSNQGSDLDQALGKHKLVCVAVVITYY